MAYKPKPIKTTVSAAIADAFSMIEELAGEMRETYDNMEGANMGHMPKCETAGQTTDELEALSQPDDPSGTIADLEVTSTEMVNKDKRKGTSRDMRLSNAQSLLQDAIGVLNETDFEELLKEQATKEGKREPKDDEEYQDVDGKSADDLSDEAQSLANELEEAANVSVEFPGMFG